MTQMTGAVAIVTGASWGIGFAIAQRFVAEGAKVCITGRNATALEEAAKDLGGPDVAIGVAGKGDDADHRAAVVDTQRRFLPEGETGELALAGSQVTLGYWRDAELTTKRFPVLEHPDHGREVWSLTGDLVRQEPGGDFHHLGRLDHQVKIQGHRVELEIGRAHV